MTLTKPTALPYSIASALAAKTKAGKVLGRITLTAALLGATISAAPPAQASSPCAPLKQMSAHQRLLLVEAYHAGRPYGFGYSLAAIAWQESSAGENRVSPNYSSFGLYQINVKTAASRLGLRTGYEKSVLSERLTYDDDYAAVHAIEELRYWQDIHGHDAWDRIWASYNNGYGWRGAMHYAAGIRDKVKVIQSCLAV